MKSSSKIVRNWSCDYRVIDLKLVIGQVSHFHRAIEKAIDLAILFFLV